MRPKHNFLDWQQGGYHSFPITSTTPGYISAEDAALWHDFEVLLGESKAGHFNYVPRALELYDATESWLIGGACVALLGDAGTAESFHAVTKIAEAMLNPECQVDMCRILGAWGKLAVVPIMVNSWVELDGYDDREAIPELLSQLLEATPGPIAEPECCESTEDYRTLVGQAYESLCEKYGTNQVVVLHGEAFGVRRLATVLLESLAQGDLNPSLRRKFEANTGLDCRPFYSNGKLQPLMAAAILEDFLESASARSYQEGGRYFFAHKLDA